MINFTGMLRAPELPRTPVYVATYSDGLGLQRQEIVDPDRLSAYAIARRGQPTGLSLTGLRKKKAPRLTATPSLAERVDVQLTRALHSIYINTDAAANFVLTELRTQAMKARNA